MACRWETTCVKCRIAINLVPFLLSVIFIRIRDAIAKSQISVGIGTGNTSLFWTDLIVGGKFGYFTLCLDLKVILLCLLKYQSDDWPFGSLQTMGTANGIWLEPFNHPVRSLTQVTQEN